MQAIDWLLEVKAVPVCIEPHFCVLLLFDFLWVNTTDDLCVTLSLEI